MNAQQFTPSELIYLFLDGEHSQVERTVLFNALVNNEDLQSEFEDALKIRAAAVQEAQALVPPAAVTQALMSRAGFVAAGAAASAPTAASWFTQWFSSWGATVLTYVVPAFTAIGGFALGYSSQDTSAAQVAQSLPQQIALPNTEEQDALATLQAENDHLRYDLASSRLAQRSLAAKNDAQQREIRALSTQRDEVSSPGTFSEISPSVPQESPESPKALTRTEATALLATEFAPQIVKIETTPLKVHLPVIVEDETRGEPSIWYDYHFSLALRGLTSLGMTQQALIANQRGSVVDNISGGLYMPVSEHWALALEAGQETFPMNVEGSNGTYLRQTFFSASAGMRYTMGPVEWLYNVQPILQLSAGGAKTGVLARGFTGLSWQPDSKVAFSVGVEGMTHYFRYQGHTENAQKIGLSYGVAIKF